MTCKSCGSFRHLIAQCPDSWENLARVNVTNEENVVLYTGNKAENVAKLGVEAQNSVVLDSACSSTVCGKTWFDNYVNSLDTGEKSKVVKANGSKIFKFGGGTCLKSLAMYTIPATLAGHDVLIKTDVAESDIPLLLSRKAMKSAQVKLDLENDMAVIFGEEVILNLTSSGHYCVPIDKCDKLNVESVFAIRIDESDYKSQKEALLKLHRQFAHPPTNKLVALLKDAGSWRHCFLDVLEVIYQECDLCKQYATTPPRPVVSMPMASRFNEKDINETRLDISAPQDNVQCVPSETLAKNDGLSSGCGTDAIGVNHKNLRPDDVIEYKIDDSPDWIQATVLNRAGKATGSYRNKS
ncbi:hypothetical protein LOTGIDRAFT_175676 [Lottia gigantea]|uniref:Uncharacterized protein n=1 Tax=Lottia gigantea TaxID=225164 RepID=V4AGZ8_LOTGI|nr:hypothetical protein LOTGIDRAFT_175676 [Lottia gigantea]ESO92681.1 hypothetical protein LOTGIDRAFT_175676 [Lottia gigantea]